MTMLTQDGFYFERCVFICKVKSLYSANRTSAEYRARHFWDSVNCIAELYRDGYRLVEVSRDGLCFLSVMYMLAHRYILSGIRLTNLCSTNQLPPEEEVHAWFMARPYVALLAWAGEPEAPAHVRAAHADFLKWQNLSLAKWRNVWRKQHFDVLCNALPKLLVENQILPQPYRCYSYVPNLKHGRWADVHGSTSPVPEARFAVLLTQTPVEHYSLLERIVKVRMFSQCH